MDDGWLDSVNAADLDALTQGLVDGRVTLPPSGAALRLAGISAGAEAFLAGLRGTDPSVVAWMLRRLARERRRADDRFASVASLVWSGPNEGPQPTRDTRVVLDELFARAERHVLISTFLIYNGRAVFAALADRVRLRPEIEVELYVNLPSKTGRDEHEAADAAAYLRTFAQEHWPEGVALPAIFYDPESRKLDARRTTLHAKWAVIDER